jgi:hypothetical protein
MTAQTERVFAAEDASSSDVAATWTAYGIAVVVALALGHFLLGLPIQVSDSFGNMQRLSASWADLMSDQFSQRAFLRPFLWAELKLVYDVSGGNYTPWFRGTHAVQFLALALLFVGLIRPRTWRDTACVPLGFTVLLGIHTFSGTVREAFPINTFMTLLILCFGAAWLALGRYHWWNDLIVAVLFIIAALTVETGLLIWVIAIGAALLGARGISRPGLALLTLLLGAYFYARFVLLDVGSPDLLERSSGFGFSILEPRELAERFGANPLPFYLYNIVSSVLSVLLSEPSGGVYATTRAMAADDVAPMMVVNSVSSIGALALLSAFSWVRRREWLSRRFTHDDRLVLLFGMVLVANAVMSYPYMKDTNLTPAGAFLAPAVFAAARYLYARLPARVPPIWATALVLGAVTISGAWSLRVLDLHGRLRQAAVTERLDWAYIESDIAEGTVHAASPEAIALKETLREDALINFPAPPPLGRPFVGLFEE